MADYKLSLTAEEIEKKLTTPCVPFWKIDVAVPVGGSVSLPEEATQQFYEMLKLPVVCVAYKLEYNGGYEERLASVTSDIRATEGDERIYFGDVNNEEGVEAALIDGVVRLRHLTNE